MSGRHSRGEEGGFILVFVIAAVLMLSALLFGFNQSARTSLGTADGFLKGEQAWNCAWAGLQITVAAVRDAGDLSQDAQFTRLVSGDAVFSVGDARCTVAVCDESGLLNVNRLKTEQGQPDRRRIDQFLRLIDMVNRQRGDEQRIGYGIVPGIIDWVDADDEKTHLEFVKNENTGAEQEYYQMRTPPRSCRNGPAEILDDLLPVKDMSAEILSCLRPYLTCGGDGKININSAPKEIIESLSEQIDGALAEMIIGRRKLKPFGSPAELRKVPGMTDKVYQSIASLITVRPTERYYRVTSRGALDDRQCAIEALLRKNTDTQNVDIIYYREL